MRLQASNKKYKILHLITSLEIGGAQVVLGNYLCKTKVDKYIHVVYYFHHGPMVNRLIDLGIKVVHIKGLISPYDPVGIWRLLRSIQKEKPDLIHASLWSATALARLMSRFLSITVLCDIHADVQKYDWFRRLAEKIFYTWSRNYRAIGKNVKKSFIALTGVQERLVQVIENGVDIQSFKSQAKYAQKKFIIGAVGRLVALKNYDHILDALAMLPKNMLLDIELYLVGDGPSRLFLEAKAQELGLDRQVHFVGNQSQVIDYYHLFDCFVLPSNTEGLSCALLEAMAMSLPIITTGRYQNHEVITHNLHGYVFRVGDITELAQSIRLLIKSRNKSCEMGQAGRLLVEHSYSLEVMVKKQELLYESIFLKRDEVRPGSG